MKIRNILFLFMGLLLVTSCTFRLSKEDKETMSQTLSVKPFEKVDVIGAYEVIYRQDTFYNVRVEGPAYCVKRMRVTSDGTTLSICKKSRSNIDEFLFNPNRSLEKYAFFLSYFCYFYSKNQALNNITSYRNKHSLTIC